MNAKKTSANIDWPLFWIIFLGITIFIIVRIMIPADGLITTWLIWLPILGAAVYIGAPRITFDAKSRRKHVRTMMVAVLVALLTIFGLEFFVP